MSTSILRSRVATFRVPLRVTERGPRVIMRFPVKAPKKGPGLQVVLHVRCLIERY